MDKFPFEFSAKQKRMLYEAMLCFRYEFNQDYHDCDSSNSFPSSLEWIAEQRQAIEELLKSFKELDTFCSACSGLLHDASDQTKYCFTCDAVFPSGV